MYIDANYDVIFTNNLLKGYSTLRLDGMHAKQSKARLNPIKRYLLNQLIKRWRDQFVTFPINFVIFKDRYLKFGDKVTIRL